MNEQTPAQKHAMDKETVKGLKADIKRLEAEIAELQAAFPNNLDDIGYALSEKYAELNWAEKTLEEVLNSLNCKACGCEIGAWDFEPKNFNGFCHACFQDDREWREERARENERYAREWTEFMFEN